MFLSPKGSRENNIISNQDLIMSNNPIPSLFASQKLFVGFSPKAFSCSDSDSSVSPTSPLETKHFSSSDRAQWSPPIGLGLIDVLHNDTMTNKKPFLFGSQLKIQVPSVLQSSSLPSSPQSPIEFGVKTKDYQLALHSPLSFDARPPPPLSSSFSPEILTDMELSEDYTCVISHGPNPKTTHIFDNCIVESCSGDGFGALRNENEVPRDGFLSFCDACRKNLSEGKDIFMYRLAIRSCRLSTNSERKFIPIQTYKFK